MGWGGVVCSGGSGPGGSAPRRGVGSGPGGGVCFRGVWSQGSVCSKEGGARWDAYPPVDRHTPVKT